MGHSGRHTQISGALVRCRRDMITCVHEEESILGFIYQIIEDKSPGNYRWKMEQMEQFSNNLLFHPQAAVVMPTAGLINPSPLWRAEAAVCPPEMIPESATNRISPVILSGRDIIRC